MDFIIYILVLLFQLDPVLSGCTVDNCDPYNCSGNNCSQCFNGFYLHAGNCQNCYLNCRSCNGECYSCGSSSCPTEMCAYANCSSVSCSSSQNIYCSSCPDGFYNDGGKCYRCLHPCKCNNYYDCIECLPGRFGSLFCYGMCHSNCTACISPADCTECIAGTYGESCQFGCISTCQDGTCDKETGTCLQVCPVGQYLYAENDCRTCPNRCSSCTDYYTCTSCNNKPLYKWGSYCQYDCTGCSMSICRKTNGCSSGCDYYYYRTYNEVRKGFDCTNCPSACMICKNETLCIKCKDGYWGSLCNKTCGSGCTTDACDQSQGCRSGCKYGFYHLSQSNTYTCVECPQHCKICLVPNKCNECEKDFYLKNASACVACSVHCKNASCGKTNDSCTNGNQACEKNDGHCIDGCKNNYWGSHCDKTCEEGCIGNICNETTGECLFGCKTTHYGTNCETECSQTCYSLGQGVRVCDIVKGSCVAGCVVGSTGSYCNETAADRPGSTESSQPDKLDNTNTSAITGLSVVVGIALLLLTVSVIFNLMLLRKWRASSPQNSDPRASEHELGSTDYEDLNQNNHESSTYSSITRDYDNTNI